MFGWVAGSFIKEVQDENLRLRQCIHIHEVRASNTAAEHARELRQYAAKLRNAHEVLHKSLDDTTPLRFEVEKLLRNEQQYIKAIEALGGAVIEKE